MHPSGTSEPTGALIGCAHDMWVVLSLLAHAASIFTRQKNGRRKAPDNWQANLPEEIK
jgi:hypothetical protein